LAGETTGYFAIGTGQRRRQYSVICHQYSSHSEFYKQLATTDAGKFSRGTGMGGLPLRILAGLVTGADRAWNNGETER
jgi:hypothetical protein